MATKSNSPVTEEASATPWTSARAGPSLAIADRSASISTMAVTTQRILSSRLAAARQTLDTTNICSYNVLVKMGGGGVSADTSLRLGGLVTAIDEPLQRFDREINEDVARVSRLRRARRQLELQMWKTSPLFCKTR